MCGMGLSSRRIRHELGVAMVGSDEGRSEEHTSELQSHLNLVCRLLLEKKKNKHIVQGRAMLIIPLNPCTYIGYNAIQVERACFGHMLMCDESPYEHRITYLRGVWMQL